MAITWSISMLLIIDCLSHNHHSVYHFRSQTNAVSLTQILSKPNNSFGLVLLTNAYTLVKNSYNPGVVPLVTLTKNIQLLAEIGSGSASR